jgi:hypothetical protein
MRKAAFGLLMALSSASLVAEETTLPVVVAMDASRSLRPAELSAARARMTALLQQLPGSTPSGLLAFADDATWVRPLGTPLSEIPAALDALELSGRHTLLHDALFTAAEGLESTGGVVLLITDGLDENSATTVEDVTRRCEAAGVTVVPVGIGRVQERALRRIALLTRGTYLGSLEQIDPSALTNAVTAATSARLAALAEQERLAAPSAEVERPPAEATPAAAPQPVAVQPIAPTPWWPLTLLALGLVAGALAVILLVRRRNGSGPTQDPRAAALEAELRAAEERELQLALRDRPVASTEETAEIAIPKDLRDEVAGDDDDPFEKTRVLAQRSLLMVKEPGAAIRSLMLRGERGFGVGRDSHGNTLRIADPAMSGHHFKIVPDGDVFVLVDLGSTNGTYVNRERVRARRLSSGDVIHAGQVEFEFRTFDQPLN